jgi:signal transduction histidine kinase
MTVLFYVRLVGFTAGSLVELFFLALILGNRRPRTFERVLFFLVLSLFAFYCGGVLLLNAVIHYPVPPAATIMFANGLTGLGLAFLPAFLFQAHVEYFLMNEAAAKSKSWLRYLAWLNYALVLMVVARVIPPLLVAKSMEFFEPANRASPPYAVWLGVTLFGSAAISFARAAKREAPFRRLDRFLGIFCALAGALTIYVYALGGPARPNLSDSLSLGILLSAIVPSAVLEYWVLRHNFLGIGSQKNLVYAVSGAFLALLYLGLVRRISGWLEPVLPPEATSSILLFTLVVLFEPLERNIGRALQRTFKRGLDKMQRLLGELQERARQGDLARFIEFVETRVQDEFGLSVARLSVPEDSTIEPLRSPGGLGHVARIRLIRNGELIGVLEAASTGSVLTGEVTAALDFLGEQLPGLIDLCRLIQEKIELERTLAERERLAMLGQMAASVSHNLRNPLSSMKTILQVQLENRDLSESARKDLMLVLSELDRVSMKLTQLLRYSKPPVHVAGVDESVPGGAAIDGVVNLLRRDAEQRGVTIEVSRPAEETSVKGSEEALSDIFMNLIVNAVESQSRGGCVQIEAVRKNGCLIVEICDAGPGISLEERSRIFQPFFTTKASGTGLGLAIVTRRLSEIGGTLDCESPLQDGRGTKFTVTLPLARS